jgi:glycerol-3-phosphate O-acyltransferase/dihydroxyacetone phosphate acyltransferase
MLFRLLRPLGRFILWVFFRRIEVRTSGCRAPAGPAIFVANHPNVALDVLLLSCHLPARTPRFLGKSTLFSNPIFSWLLRGLGVIPVVRSREGSGGRNRDMLRSSCRALQGGESLVLFPEGLSHPEPRVLQLKPGASKIALRATAEGVVGVRVIPVGLTYTDPELFRGDVSIHIGEEIEIAQFMKDHEIDRSGSERRLTDRITASLRALTQHIENPDLDLVIKNLTTIYGEELAAQLPETVGFSHTLAARREITKAAHLFSREEPELVRSVSRKLNAHYNKLSRLRIDASALPGRTPSTALLLLTILAAPLILYGFVHNALPYYLPRLLVRKYAREKEMVATVKLVSGTILFPMVYLMFASVVYSVYNPVLALIYVASMPVSGLMTLILHERVFHRWPLWQRLAFPGRRRHHLEMLSNERTALISMLDDLKNRYAEIAPEAEQNTSTIAESDQKGTQ